MLAILAAACAPKASPSESRPAARAESHREPDGDSDGVADAVDACPKEHEDHQCVYQEGRPECCGALDGCPNLDPDQDGVPVERDACPTQAEYWNGFEDEDGCPDPRAVETDVLLSAALVRRELEQRKVRERIRSIAHLKECPVKTIIEGYDVAIYSDVPFSAGDAKIWADSAAELDQIVATLKEFPQILWVEASGFASYEEEDSVALSFRRAEAVVTALVERGVPREKLGSVGYGPYCSRESRRDERVEVRIVLTEDGPLRGERGCEQASANGLTPPPLHLLPSAQ